MPMPAPQQFDIAPMLNAFSQGRAAKVALEDRQAAMEQRAQDAIFRAADLADTPEKWDKFITTIGAQFPDADLSEFSDFSSREAAIAQSMDPYQRAQLDLAQRDQALQERAFATNEARAAAADARATALTTEATVNGILGQRDPDGTFTPYPQWMQTGAAEPPPDFDNENALRNHFDQLAVNYRTVDQSYNQISAVAQDGTGASDMALIFSYMKMLDPGSTVREGEYANAQNTTSLPGTLLNIYNKAVDGTYLNPEQRSQFVASAETIHQASQNQYTALQNQYRELATGYGFDPNRIVITGAQQVSPNAAPAGFVTPQPAAAAPAAASPAYGVTAAPAAGAATPAPTVDLRRGAAATVAPAAAAPAAAAPAVAPDQAQLTRENIVATLNAWTQAGQTPGQALQALATQYGMTIPQVRALLGQP